MTIIFYDANEEKLYICTPYDKTKIVNVNDPNIMDHIPNDDLLYVTNGHWMEKRQFFDWLQGEMEIEDDPDVELDRGPSRVAGFLGNNQQQPAKSTKKRYYIHPTANGTVRIEDIKTLHEPDGIELSGKWDFRAVDDIGQDVLDESTYVKILLGKNKIEIVDEEYYEQNKHKHKTSKSPAEQSLDAILVPSDRRAIDVAADGGLEEQGNVAIPIIVEG
jgi:hypothetical protein